MEIRRKILIDEKSHFLGLSCKQDICCIIQHIGSSLCLQSVRAFFSFKLEQLPLLSGSTSVSGSVGFRSLDLENIAADDIQKWMRFLSFITSSISCLPIFSLPEELTPSLALSSTAASGSTLVLDDERTGRKRKFTCRARWRRSAANDGFQGRSGEHGPPSTLRFRLGGGPTRLEQQGGVHSGPGGLLGGPWQRLEVPLHVPEERRR